jgi:hypothetical protein
MIRNTSYGYVNIHLITLTDSHLINENREKKQDFVMHLLLTYRK